MYDILTRFGEKSMSTECDTLSNSMQEYMPEERPSLDVVGYKLRLIYPKIASDFWKADAENLNLQIFENEDDLFNQFLEDIADASMVTFEDDVLKVEIGPLGSIEGGARKGFIKNVFGDFEGGARKGFIKSVFGDSNNNFTISIKIADIKKLPFLWPAIKKSLKKSVESIWLNTRKDQGLELFSEIAQKSSFKHKSLKQLVFDDEKFPESYKTVLEKCSVETVWATNWDVFEIPAANHYFDGEFSQYLNKASKGEAFPKVKNLELIIIFLFGTSGKPIDSVFLDEVEEKMKQFCSALGKSFPNLQSLSLTFQENAFQPPAAISNHILQNADEKWFENVPKKVKGTITYLHYKKNPFLKKEFEIHKGLTFETKPSTSWISFGRVAIL